MTIRKALLVAALLAAGVLFVPGATTRAQDHHPKDHPKTPEPPPAQPAGPALPANPAGMPCVFTDVSNQAGITFIHRVIWPEAGVPVPDKLPAWLDRNNSYGHGTGVLTADVNNDGFMDLYYLNQDGPNGLFMGRADGTFANRTASSGLAVEDRVCAGGAFGDFDNDGWVDVFIPTARGGNLLFRNEGGRFVDVSKKAGLAAVTHGTTATWVDLDNDGYLDLYLGNQCSWTTDDVLDGYGYYKGVVMMHHAPSEPDVFYHNNGDGTFADWTAKVGIVNDPMKVYGDHPRVDKTMPMFWTMDIAAGDFDGDHWPDLYVSNGMGYDAYYHNKGDGTLDLKTWEIFRETPAGSFGAKWADFDNDAQLDLYVVDMHSDMWTNPDWKVDPKEFNKRYNNHHGPMHGEMPRTEGDPHLYGNALYVNEFSTTREASQFAGLENMHPWGIATADFDWDGNLDVYVAAGMGKFFNYLPSFFYLNRGFLRFEELAAKVGLEPPLNGTVIPGMPILYTRAPRAVAAIDYNNDGAVDLARANWADQAGLYRNWVADPQKHWIGFKLEGRKANRDAMGAKVFLTGKDGVTRLQAVSNACGYLSQSDPRLVFGLGTATEISRIEVVWPGGKKQTVADVKIDAYNHIVEK